MTPEKEQAYKRAQHAQANMQIEERASLANLNIEIKDWIRRRQQATEIHQPVFYLMMSG